MTKKMTATIHGSDLTSFQRVLRPGPVPGFFVSGSRGFGGAAGLMSAQLAGLACPPLCYRGVFLQMELGARCQMSLRACSAAVMVPSSR